MYKGPAPLLLSSLRLVATTNVVPQFSFLAECVNVVKGKAGAGYTRVVLMCHILMSLW